MWLLLFYLLSHNVFFVFFLNLQTSNGNNTKTYSCWWYREGFAWIRVSTSTDSIQTAFSRTILADTPILDTSIIWTLMKIMNGIMQIIILGQNRAKLLTVTEECIQSPSTADTLLRPHQCFLPQPTLTASCILTWRPLTKCRNCNKQLVLPVNRSLAVYALIILDRRHGQRENL